MRAIDVILALALLSLNAQALRADIDRIDIESIGQGDEKLHSEAFHSETLEVDENEIAEMQKFESTDGHADRWWWDDDGPQVKSCQSGVHTYINLGDGGCFQYLSQKVLGTEQGEFKDSESEAAYKKQFCPYALPGDAAKRKALVWWYIKSVRQGQVPFTINDLAMSCLIDNVETVDSRFGIHTYFDTDVSNKAFCEVMLSLPLMFEAIGFDGPGVLLEDLRTSTTWTYKGRVGTKLKDARPGPSEGCSGFSSSSIGPAKYGRLALRAILPTYFRHRYAQGGTGMVVKGIRVLNPFSSTKFKTSYWQEQVAAVCNVSSSADKLQELFSFANLKAGKLISTKAMERDSGQCDQANPCNYAADPQTHLGACDICAGNPDYPWFDEAEENCWNGRGSSGREKCNDPSAEKRTCDCHKAICWYFTRDFEAAMSAAGTACKHIDNDE